MSSSDDSILVSDYLQGAAYGMLADELLLQPGDIVAVNHGAYGRKEGLVVGSHIDYAVSDPVF